MFYYLPRSPSPQFAEPYFYPRPGSGKFFSVTRKDRTPHGGKKARHPHNKSQPKPHYEGGPDKDRSAETEARQTDCPARPANPDARLLYDGGPARTASSSRCCREGQRAVGPDG